MTAVTQSAQSNVTCDSDKSYIPISVKTLQPDRTAGVALYQLEPYGYRLYRAHDVPIEEADLVNLLRRGHTTLYVEAKEQSKYQQYLRDSLKTLCGDERLSVEKRFAALNDVIRDVLGKSFQRGDTEEAVHACRELSAHSVGLICHDDFSSSELFGVLYHDYHTFTHSANVAYYCVMLANALGYSDELILRQVSTGGLLHDIGKLDIPEGILTKPGKLTDEEFAIIRTHPTTGLLKIRDRSDLSFGQKMMAYQHHERLNGSGYPVGVIGREMHDWAKICAIVDIFEACTSTRPYRKGMSKKAALEILDREAAAGGLEKEMLRCWKAIVEQI